VHSQSTKSWGGFSMKRLLTLIVAISLVLALPAMAGTTINSTTQSVTVNITVAESVTLSLSGGPINLPANGNVSNSVTSTYGYTLIPANHTTGVWAVAWFSSATAALSGAANVPASAISLQTDAGAFATCGGSAMYGITVTSATCVASNVINQPGVTTTPTASGYNDTFTLKYTGAALNAGSYTGTLNVMYIAP
jgi:hypothetical protein